MSEALETDPAPGLVRQAAHDPVFGLEARLAAAYRKHRTSEPPAKSPSEFHPAWLLDYTTFEHDPYVREKYFVARAVLYAHRVAVQNELCLVTSEEPGAYWQPARLTQLCERIIVYDALEEAGILFYVPPMTRRHENRTTHAFSEEVLSSFAHEVMKPAYGDRIRTDMPLAFGAWLHTHLGELDALLRTCSEQESIDLFLPDWFPYRRLLEWLGARSDIELVALSSADHASDAGRLAALLTLPALNAEASRVVTVENLIDLRRKPAFDRWRRTLGSELDSFARALAVEAPADAAAQELRMALSAKADGVSREIGSYSSFRDIRGGSGQIAIGLAATTATAAGFSTHDAAATAATGVAAAAAAIQRPLRDALRSWLGLPATVRAVEKHFRLFAAD